jgi:tripartite-type tricarboxylate transporter receptor subunit TctC
MVAFPAGGFADSFARLLGNRLSERLGQAVVIENRPGAGGNVAAAAAARAPEDGHTFLVTTNALAINEHLTKDSRSLVEQLKPVSISAGAPDVLIVNAKHPARSLAQLVEHAKGRPINFGTPGRGTVGHIVTTYLFKQLGNKVEAIHVPFQGGAPVVNALLGEHIEMAAGATVGYSAQLLSGAFRAIAVSSAKRLPAFPDVPTYIESGLPELVITNWVGVFLPAQTAEPIAVKLNEAIDAVTREPQIVERIRSLLMEPRYADRPTTDKLFKEEVAQWAKMTRAIGIAEK